MTEELNSKKIHAGDKFSGYLSSPVTVDGQTVAVRNALVEGEVVEVKSPAHGDESPALTLQLTRLIINGESYTIKSAPWSSRKTSDTKVGGGAAVGAVIGALAGGGKGAAIGAGMGSASGSASNKDGEVILRPESVIHFTLQNSVTVTQSDN